MMAITSGLAFIYMRSIGWSLGVAACVFGFFLVLDLTFLSANLLKIVEGGWVPVLVAIIVFTIMSTWWHGRRVMWASMVAVLLIAVAAPSALRIIDERLSPPESDDQSLSSRSVVPAKPQMTDPPKITDQPRSLEQNVRPGRPAAKESSAQPAPAAAAPQTEPPPAAAVPPR